MGRDDHCDGARRRSVRCAQRAPTEVSAVRVVTLLGTRPEIIRLSLIIKLLDRFCDHTLIHTGQNYDAALSDVFFRELELRPPDHYLGVRASGFAEQGA